ncbi:MAG: hypothetical protein KJ661_05490, partial [Candidatus Omnitrophica bacterium]|nr:hypothetical protein [Candidatus Omnitrophota bacterium]
RLSLSRLFSYARLCPVPLRVTLVDRDKPHPVPPLTRKKARERHPESQQDILHYPNEKIFRHAYNMSAPSHKGTVRKVQSAVIASEAKPACLLAGRQSLFRLLRRKTVLHHPPRNDNGRQKGVFQQPHKVPPSQGVPLWDGTKQVCIFAVSRVYLQKKEATMDSSTFIARIFGLYYLIIGVGIIFNRKAFQQLLDDFCKSAALVFFGGLFALVVGLAIVLTHNIWVADWTVLITILGWGALLKGIWLIVFPGTVFKFMQSYQKNKNMLIIQPIIVLILGVVMTYFGFFAD